MMKKSSHVQTPRDSTQFSAMFKENVSLMHSLATRRVGPIAADDIVSEAFLLAWNKQIHCLEPTSARGWLIVTVGNLCRNLVRFTIRNSQ